jgi:alginate O-acetyltransferase complex protein AlgI
VLFNTLAYAQFFACVFVAAWLLVDRRFAVVLPALAVGVVGLQLGQRAVQLPLVWLTLFASAVTAAAALWYVRRGPSEGRAFEIRLRGAALAALGTATLGLTAMTEPLFGTDPFRLGLKTLGIPLPAPGPVGWLIAALCFCLALGLLIAKKSRLLLLLVSSYVFYAHWDYRFLPLIWASSTADWLLGHAIARAPQGASRKRWLVLTVVMNLGVLGLFKYWNFGIDSASALLQEMGLPGLTATLEVALPVGISFFTFESMSYVIDVYRGELEPHRSYAEYLTFVAFFPHLVAGPIVRPKDLLPQLAGASHFDSHGASEGLFLIAVGLGKKVLIGDFLALRLVDQVFDSPLFYSAVEVYAAVVGYALQIYCDFSGYTDIAIGSALLLGVRFPKNFDSPYKSTSIIEFWRRWHISLSTWLRDYLYIPLGGNRRGPARTYLNLLLTMLLGGLWHGAAWTFVIWGALHGVGLAVNRFWSERWARHRTDPPSFGRRAVLLLLTFHFVCLGWIFFRAPTLGAAGLVLQRLASLTTHHQNLSLQVLAALGAGLVFHFVPEGLFERIKRTYIALPAVAQGVVLFAVAVLLRQIGSADSVPFVYFQF